MLPNSSFLIALRPDLSAQICLIFQQCFIERIEMTKLFMDFLSFNLLTRFYTKSFEQYDFISHRHFIWKVIFRQSTLFLDLENFLYCTTTVLFILLSAGHCCEKQNKTKNFYKMLSWIFAIIHSRTYKWADHSEFLTKYLQVT